jgi:lipoprotein-anchoring transpeptidase ErfK/SrfK
VSKHRHHPVRPRYGRIGVAATSVTVTVIAVLGGLGALPSAAESSKNGAITTTSQTTDRRAAEPEPSPTPSPSPTTSSSPTPQPEPQVDVEAAEEVLPADSGEGRRVVFSESRQRVWLVGARGRVLRTYLVSGSVEDNLDPGTYAVYSRSQQAWGIDDSGTMQYFVRFAHGDRAAIGFHDIPIDDGKPVQTVADLGTPMSHGCIRQKRADAIALWEFAPLGTTVVVTL